jgi:hypothetical protein
MLRGVPFTNVVLTRFVNDTLKTGISGVVSEKGSSGIELGSDWMAACWI